MEIRTNSQIDPMGLGTWAVVAEWFGCDRAVFTGTVFECLAYRRRMA